MKNKKQERLTDDYVSIYDIRKRNRGKHYSNQFIGKIINEEISYESGAYEATNTRWQQLKIYFTEAVENIIYEPIDTTEQNSK